jgi:hypothetical protein
MTDHPTLSWTDPNGLPHTARWRSESGVPAPRRVMWADDQTSADRAYRLVCEGTALLWQGDFQNGRQLLQALVRRLDKREAQGAVSETGMNAVFPQAFHLHRKRQAERARILGQLLIRVSAGHRIDLRRAPDVRLAGAEAHGPAEEHYVASLRELLGIVGAHEWRKNGVEVPALGARIHPHYGVFSPAAGRVCRPGASSSPFRQRWPNAAWPSTSAPAPACWPPCWRSAAWCACWPPTATAARWTAPAPTWTRLKLRHRSSWWRPTCSRPAARRWWCATRPGCPPRRPHRRWNTRSTTPTAACCAVFSAGWPRTWSPGAKAG